MSHCAANTKLDPPPGVERTTDRRVSVNLERVWGGVEATSANDERLLKLAKEPAMAV